MTTLFHAPPEAFDGGTVVLPEDEARHAVRVLRHGVGDELVVVDGVGGRHRVRLTEVDRRGARGTVVATEREPLGPPIVAGLALLKHPGRFETFVEKAVELGATALVPLQTARTERVRWRPERVRAVAVAAMKQAGRARLPALHAPRLLPDVLAADWPAPRLLCHEAAAPEAALWRHLAAGPPAGGTVLVGPEGGFTDDEVAEAVRAGWHVVSLGPQRLRAETAALAAVAALMLRAAGRE